MKILFLVGLSVRTAGKALFYDSVFSWRGQSVTTKKLEIALSLAGGESRVNICLAGRVGIKKDVQENMRKSLAPFILESFVQVTPDSTKLLKYYPFYMLDSGAFSFITGTKQYTKADFMAYVDKYIAYVNENNIKHFFEMDVDSMLGYQKVLELRKYINSETGKKCIPVWHRSRGRYEFEKMCEEHDYVALGGLALKTINHSEYCVLPKLIAEAHRRKAKIHGLGFTSMKWLPKCHFDSVDSTAWLAGCRFGFLDKFNGRSIIRIHRPPSTRLRDSVKVAIHNFKEWVKFQKWAVNHL